MAEITPFLKELISSAGLSGYEGPVLEIIREKWSPLVDEISVGKLGSLQGLRRGRGPEKRPATLLAAHMDAIGLIVTSIADGFLHINEVGGVDPRVLPGLPVIVHGKQDLPGIVALPPRSVLPESDRDAQPGLGHLVVDLGLPARRVSQLVRVGDLVSFDTPPIELAGDTLSGHSLDNRASVAAITICLEELQSKQHDWDVWAVATTQEEETFGGAISSAYALKPDLAIAVDVTFAKGPGAEGWETFGLGKGPTLSWGANLHPYLYRKFEELAKSLEIPAVRELTPRHSGTDAFAFQVTRDGIPSFVIGLPLRYMHTAVEVVSIKDIQRAGRLLAEFVCSLKPDFLSEITWEEKDGG